jgi:hypothetical protein
VYFFLKKKVRLPCRRRFAFFPSCVVRGRGYGGGEKMIYRSWSLLSSTATIWGGVAAAGLAGVFHFGGKVSSLAIALF